MFKFHEQWGLYGRMADVLEYVFGFNLMSDVNGTLVAEEIHIQHTISTNTFHASYSGVGGQIPLSILSTTDDTIVVSHIPFYSPGAHTSTTYYLASFNIHTHEASVLGQIIEVLPIVYYFTQGSY